MTCDVVEAASVIFMNPVLVVSLHEDVDPHLSAAHFLWSLQALSEGVNT